MLLKVGLLLAARSLSITLAMSWRANLETATRFAGQAAVDLNSKAMSREHGKGYRSKAGRGLDVG
jgi:hypothetical protein